MIIDFSKVLVDLDNKPLEASEGVLLTLDRVCVNALLSEIKDEHTTGEQKFHRYNLAKTVYSAGPIEIKVEDVVLLKEQVAKLYLPLVVGQVFEILG